MNKSVTVKEDVEMPNFAKYLNDLQVYEGHKPIKLIREWTKGEISHVENVFHKAVKASGIIGAPIPKLIGTPVADGNLVTALFVAKISLFLPRPNSIIDYQSNGYPTQVFVSKNVGYFLSTKATSKWGDNDTLRRVLTCKPKRMIDLVKSGKVDTPPAHMICTVLYSNSKKTTTKIRLDFLQPDSEVNIRFEASTTQRQLYQGLHHSVDIT